MAFKMPRPIRRRDSQNAQFTQRIPSDLLEVAPGTVISLSLRPERAGAPPHLLTARCGKTHVRVSLGTSDAKLAKMRQAQVLAALGEHWQVLRGQAVLAPSPVRLLPRQCAQLAGEVYRLWQEGLEQDPALSPEAWQRVADGLAAIEAGKGPRASQLVPLPTSQAYQDAIAEDMEDRTRSHVDAVLSAANLTVDVPSRRLLTKRVFEALKYNALQSARMAAGEPLRVCRRPFGLS